MMDIGIHMIILGHRPSFTKALVCSASCSASASASASVSASASLLQRRKPKRSAMKGMVGMYVMYVQACRDGDGDGDGI